ncbi:hypothetical protein H5410_053534, partial [Solanum commersonii]
MKIYCGSRGDGRKIALGRHGTTTEEVIYFCFVVPRHLMGIDVNEMLLTSLLTNYERKGQDILICRTISLGIYSNCSRVMEDEELPNP